eukprot:1178032-Prorocentrum_minimum.AAC.2
MAQGNDTIPLQDRGMRRMTACERDASPERRRPARTTRLFAELSAMGFRVTSNAGCLANPSPSAQRYSRGRSVTT